MRPWRHYTTAMIIKQVLNYRDKTFWRDTGMKKTYKIEVDCANCANKMEEAARGTAGVQAATEIGRAHV